MEKDEIKINDFHRILIGNAPAAFLLEVFLRTIIIYLALLIILRLMGKRMNGQLTISEMAVMITLGAIVSMPMQSPESGIVQGFLILACALFFQRGLNFLNMKSQEIEKVTQGTESMLVKDGVLQISEMQKNNISRQQLYAVLRSRQVLNLGEVERVYLEACGIFSIFKFGQARPGLSLLPGKDRRIKAMQTEAREVYVCRNCGGTVKAPATLPCPSCGKNQWIKAIK